MKQLLIFLLFFSVFSPAGDLFKVVMGKVTNKGIIVVDMSEAKIGGNYHSFPVADVINIQLDNGRKLFIDDATFDLTTQSLNFNISAFDHEGKVYNASPMSVHYLQVHPHFKTSPDYPDFGIEISIAKEHYEQWFGWTGLRDVLLKFESRQRRISLFLTEVK